MPRPKNLTPTCKECGLRTDDLSKYKKSYNKREHSGYCNLCLRCARSRYRESMERSDRRGRHALRDFVREAKSKPCADCGGSYPFYVMQFDHLPGVDKEFNISRYATKTREQVEHEISKCEVVCANCHAARTFERLKKGSE